MKTKNNLVMVDRHLSLKERGIISSIRNSNRNRNSNYTSIGNVKVAVFCSEYLYMGYKEYNFFQQGGVKRPMELMESLILYFKDFKLKGKQQKQEIDLLISV